MSSKKIQKNLKYGSSIQQEICYFENYHTLESYNGYIRHFEAIQDTFWERVKHLKLGKSHKNRILFQSMFVIRLHLDSYLYQINTVIMLIEGYFSPIKYKVGSN